MGVSGIGIMGECESGRVWNDWRNRLCVRMGEMILGKKFEEEKRRRESKNKKCILMTHGF